MKEENIVRRILNNEALRYGAAGVAVWKVYTSIILPLNNLQYQATQIQSQLTKQDSQYDTLNTAVNVLTTSVSVLKSRVDTLTKK